MDELRLKLTLEIDELRQQLEEARGEVTKLQGELSNVGKTSGTSGESVQLSSVREQLRAAQAEASRLTTSFREVVNIQGQGRAASERYVAGLRDVVEGLKQLRGRADEGTTTQVALEGSIRGTTETIVRLERELAQLESQQSLAKQKEDSDQFRNSVTSLETEFKKLVNTQRQLIQSNELNADAQARLKAEYAQVAESAQKLADANEGDAARIKRIESLTTSRLQAEKQLNTEIQRKAREESKASGATDDSVDANTRLQRKLQEIIETSRDLDLARKQTLAQGELEASQVDLLEKEYDQLTKQLSELRKEYVGNAQATKRIQLAQSQVFNATERSRTGFRSASSAIADSQKVANTANQTFIELGRGLSDAQQFAFGLQSGLIAISNNLAQTSEIGTRLVTQTGGIRGAFSALATSLTGVGGLIFAVNAVTLALPFLGKAFDSMGSSAKEADNTLKDLDSTLKLIRGSQLQEDFFGLQSLEAEAEDLQKYQAALLEVEAAINSVKVARAEGNLGVLLNTGVDDSTLDSYQNASKLLSDLRDRYGDVADLSLEEITEEQDKVSSKIERTIKDIENFGGGVGLVYKDVSNLLQQFASQVDKAGNPVTSFSSQLSLLKTTYEDLLVEFSSDEQLSQAERNFLSWLNGIITQAESRVPDMPKLLDPSSISKDVDSIYNEIMKLFDDIDKLRVRDEQAEIDILGSQVQIELAQRNFDEAQRLAEQQLKAQQDFLDNLELTDAEYRANELKNIINFNKTIDRIEKERNSNTETNEKERLNALRRLTAENAVIQADSFKGASDLLKEDQRLREERARATITDPDQLSSALDQIAADAKAAIFDVEKSRLNIIQQFGQASLDALTGFAEAGANIGLLSARQTFNAQKALGISSATIDAYRTISSIMADPTLPTFVKIPLSIAQGASAFARVAAIASTKFGDSSVSATSSSGGASNFSEGFGFSEITPNSQPVSTEADSISERLRNTDIQSNNITIENRVSNKEFYTLVKSGEGEILANSQSASRDRF